MFSIVIVIFSILLVAVMVAAGTWYGGTIFIEHSQKVEVNKILSDINQIRGSTVMYETYKGGKISDPNELVNKGFLSQFPSGWEVQNGYLVLSGVSDAACQIVNTQYGYDIEDEPPTCDAAVSANTEFLGCCVN